MSKKDTRSRDGIHRSHKNQGRYQRKIQGETRQGSHDRQNVRRRVGWSEAVHIQTPPDGNISQTLQLGLPVYPKDPILIQSGIKETKWWESLDEFLSHWEIKTLCHVCLFTCSVRSYSSSANYSSGASSGSFSSLLSTGFSTIRSKKRTSFCPVLWQCSDFPFVSGRQIRLGEIVLIHDEDTKRLRLMRSTGFVTELRQSRDGLIRSVVLRTPW